MNISLTLELRGTNTERNADLKEEEFLIGITQSEKENLDFSDKGKNTIST